MDTKTFFKKFELFADAPNAVEKMRELVLQLAIRGKLVDQDCKDEPTLVLLDKIASHKSMLRKQGKLRGPTTVSPMIGDDGDYELPTNWAWVRLGEIMVNRDCERIPVSKEERETKAKIYDYYGASGIIDKIDNYLFEKPLLLIGEDGANLINRSTPIAFIARGKYWVNNHAHVLDGLSEGFLRFIELHINAINLERYITGSAQPKMNQAKMNTIPIALPPLEEQERIVKKVDELMALCDRLELQQQERDTQQKALTRASLARFQEDPNPKTLQFLFHRSYNIPPAELRKAILSLAVRGKLVPQDTSDEPVSNLIIEFSRRKIQFLQDKRSRHQPVSNYMRENEFPFEIPGHWKWIRLGEAVTLLGGYAYESSSYIPRSSNQIIRLGNVKSDALLLDQKPTFIPDDLAEQTADYALLEGDILITMTGTKAKRDYAFTLIVMSADLCTRRLFLNQRVGAIRPFQREFVPLVNAFLKSDQLLDHIFATSTGTANQANIGIPSILDLPFPIPPLGEQYRIMAKLEQLMCLIDALEKQITASRPTASNLLPAFIAELNAQEQN